MIDIRPMTAADLEQVVPLERATPEAPHWDRTIYVSLLAQDAANVRYGAFVAMDSDNLAGFIVARLILEVCEVESIVVAETARRKGVGSALLDAVLRWAADGGARRVQLDVRAGNVNAIRFYETAGLLKEGLRRRYYRDPEDDAILLGKGLFSID